MEKTISRIRAYQKRHLAAGLCVLCPSARMPRSKWCLRHFIFNRLTRYGLTRGNLDKLKRNKREALAASLSGRYHAVRRGFLEPPLAEQTYKEAVELRIRLNILWGGVRGGQKLARVMRALDSHALKSRKAEHAGVTETIVLE